MLSTREFQLRVLDSLSKIECCQARLDERVTVLEKRNVDRRGDWKSFLLLIAGAVLATLPGCVTKLGLM